MRNTSTRLLTSLSFFCLLASSAFAGGIKHPSDYGATPVTLANCPGTPTTSGAVVATCYVGSGSGFDDFLFSFALTSPSPTTSITSVTFDFHDAASEFGLVEGTSGDPCSGLVNVPCLPAGSPVDITGDPLPLLSGSHTFDFANFTGDLSGEVTAYFTAADGGSAPTFTGDTTSSSTSTPEPSEIGILILSFGCLVAARRKQLAKQNS
jgi:hypothetical protein